MIHDFLFQSGVWLGEGKISFSASPNIINFYTRWKIFLPSEDEVRAVQNIELEGVKEHVINYYDIKEMTSESFKLFMSNDNIGEHQAKGTLSPEKIFWAYYKEGNLQGFETYSIQPNGEYIFHAEYISMEGDKTIVEGRLWAKQEGI